jgi:hypothetical protein
MKKGVIASAITPGSDLFYLILLAYRQPQPGAPPQVQPPPYPTPTKPGE